MTVSCVKTAELIEILFGVEPDKVEETMNEVGLGTPREGNGHFEGSYLDMPRLARGRYSQRHSLEGGSDAPCTVATCLDRRQLARRSACRPHSSAASERVT